MPRILTQDLIPGMVTAEDVFSYNNQLILPKDLELTDKAITKLEFYSIMSVLVKEGADNVTAAGFGGEGGSCSEKVRSTR